MIRSPAALPQFALFMNGQRGLAVLDALAEVGMHPCCVVSHGPVAMTASGRKGAPAGIRHLHMEDRTTSTWSRVLELLRVSGADVGIVAGFSFLLPKDVLRSVPRGFINLHAGRVPKYRGGSPLNWQMIEGEPTAVLSMLVMTSGIDDGPVVDTATIPIGTAMTIAELHAEANRVFGERVVDVMTRLDAALAAASPQREEDAQYWHQRSDDDGRFDPTRISVMGLSRLVRAISRPYPGAWAWAGDAKLRVFGVAPSVARYRGTPGRIVRLGNQEPVLVLGDGSLTLLDYEFEGTSRSVSNGVILT